MKIALCQACGGALEQGSGSTWRCAFCGTTHELSLDDQAPVQALMERNNERWRAINAGMATFFDTVNRAASFTEAGRMNRRRWVLVNLWFLAVLAAIGIAMFMSMDVHGGGPPAGAVIMLVVVALIDLGLNVLLYAGNTIQRRNLERLLVTAQEQLRDVLDTYRPMSRKPALEIFASLHDPSKLADAAAQSLAQSMYEAVAARSAAASS